MEIAVDVPADHQDIDAAVQPEHGDDKRCKTPVIGAVGADMIDEE